MNFLRSLFIPLLILSTLGSLSAQSVEQEVGTAIEADSLIRDTDAGEGVLHTPEDLLPLEPRLEIDRSRDQELEQLLQRWFDGYTLHGTHYQATKPDSLLDRREIPNVHDSVYIAMLEALPSAMRMSYNSLVREGIELYLFRRQDLLRSMLSVADLYFPQMELLLDRAGLPLELKYLTIVESALNPRAVSPVGARGLWQFMLPTGKIYGLTINSLVDERMDLEKSTEAACRMLKDLHTMYDDWWLAIAAYNCGPGNVNRAIKRAGGGDQPKSFWEIYRFLPAQTRRYVPLFIGAYFSMYYHKQYGIEPRELGQALATDQYLIQEATTFDRLAELTGVDREVIAAFNPQFKRGIIPGNTRSYPIRLPIQGILNLEAKDKPIRSDQLSISLEAPNLAADKAGKGKKGKKGTKGTKGTTYRVRSGDTLSSIARNHHTTVKKIKQLNGLRSDRLKIGKTLRVD
ncbi:lytic transglycosylase domain-containing protein [Porphyromonas sp. COT-239 OH1446]|uniref:lytic transglycosylase domain-containing protein n=1 Tax=Porphyromonas sp. COT-239 OH1446 TaxID=1515613 RepID=UPI000A43B6B3|nr:lytic transglycosylase domain-containing protein [Porphyromonas sp. COT-239 OH1446]